MLRRFLVFGVLSAAMIAGRAHADIMHWYWEVEVNGTPADASQPIVVGAGDQVDIELWAEMSPERVGFAESMFAITSDDRFFTIGGVNISPTDGYGLGDSLKNYASDDDFGEAFDSDGSGMFDMIDHIHPFQPPLEIPPNDTDLSNPIMAYSIGWALPPTMVFPESVTLTRTPTLYGEFFNTVYLDGWGAVAEYTSENDALVFIPAPSSLITCVILHAWYSRRPNRRKLGGAM